MPSQEITLQMCITELERTIASREKNYAELICKGKFSHYTRDHRQAIMKTLLRLLKKAKAEKPQTFVQLINQLP